MTFTPSPGSRTPLRHARIAAGLIGAGALVLGMSLSAADTASAANASTKYLTIFRETSPTAIADGTVSRYGVKPASALWFDSWGSGKAFPTSDAKTLWGQGVIPHFTWEPWNTA